MLQLKSKFQLAESDLEQGHFRGLATMFGSVIEAFVPTVIHPGAFTKTLQDRKRQVKVLWQHQSEEPIGIPVELKETAEGLEISGRLSMTQRGRDALILLRDGVVDALSIGFDAIREELEKQTDGAIIRHLREIRLWEVSLCTWGADPNARILEVYSAQPYQNVPMALPETPWDAEAAETRVRAWSGATDVPNERYRRAFAWVDPRQAEAWDAHRLLIADVIDGELRMIPAAVQIAAGCLPALPPHDRPVVAETLQRYQDKASHLVDETCHHLFCVVGELPTLTHAGRVLSAKNKQLVQDCMDALQKLLAAAEPPSSDEEQALTAARLDQLRRAELLYAAQLVS